MWYIANSKDGGDLDTVVNNEDFSVPRLAFIPTAKSIVDKNTQENILPIAIMKSSKPYLPSTMLC
jgi:hypothetical protein